MKNNEIDPSISALFESAAQVAEKKRKWKELGYICDPCDPLLPIKQPKAFYGENNHQFRDLIASIIEFIQEPKYDLLILKGPQGSGKTVFAHIFEKYSQKLNISATYQDASTFFVKDTLDENDSLSLGFNGESENIIFLDNSFHLHKTILKLSSLKSSISTNSPKIVAIMSSTEFEIYRRLCIQTGDKSYYHFLSMPHLNTADITNIIQRRLVVCYGKQNIPPMFENLVNDIAILAFGNPGIAIRFLEEILKFSRSLEDIRLSFGIDVTNLRNFPPSKSPILKEILIREVENESLAPSKREYMIHKELTNLMNKTKSTISHHLGDLLSRNVLYEQLTARDKREKAYRPNKTIIGILEHLAIEQSITEDVLIPTEGINHEK